MAEKTCPRCSASVDEAVEVCPTCGYNFTEAPATAEEIPWKRRQELGFFNALIETVKQVITQPQAFYKALTKDGDWASPIIYAIIVGWVGAFVGFIWSLMISPLPFLPAMRGREGLAALGMMGGVGLAMVILYPIFYIIILFIWSGILYLIGLLLGDSEQGFEMTFKSVAYANTASLARVIPFCGGWISGIWALVLIIFGLKETHKTETWKAILTPLIPAFLCFLCAIFLTFVLGASILGALGAAMHR